jgi:ATP-dependent Lhr-like helicase
VPLSLFHPAVSRWFAQTLGEPTAAQRAGWPHIQAGRHTLIAAPTGSGKTLAAFLASLDDLFREGLRARLPDEVRVVYVSPLKALSTDVHRNLEEPRDGIRRVAREMGLDAPEITAAVRTGDTTQAERAAMLRRPPHILVTTPESLYLLLTAEKSRDMLRTARTVIVDEIHAVIGTRRGAHLALTLERLQHVAHRPLVRVGLSATQKPIDAVARFLVGAGDARDAATSPACAIVDEGHRRAMDLGIELPGSPLDAVMAREIWDEYYDRLATSIAAHRTTLVFVNTRRLAERVARHLSDRLGADVVTAHHGSLSKEKRRDAEERLKSGRLSALVATASLELGIDIGHVDLVCQIGSPRRIATLLQRVGRSGHTVAGLPKGRLLPVSRDDLVECAALLRAVRRGELDAIVPHEAPLDVLAQQIVAEAACHDWAEADLFSLVRRAWPYRGLARGQFTAVVTMLAEGFSTRRGRRAALVHRDEVHGRVRGRRGARLLAIGSGGAIPDVADYRVIVEPDDTFIGTLNEDFAIESAAGDVFQLGNASWRVLRVGPGEVRVADAHGAPPTIPFWLGEAPARSDELSRAVSELRADVGALLAASRGTVGTGTLTDHVCLSPSGLADLCGWLEIETGIPRGAAEQIAAYLADAERLLGILPTQDTLVVERFFDASGGMQLVLHAPFGSRVNKAWGLALRKRFCRQFNFELQAAATEDALLLSLGPQHSFPLADVFRYLHPATARDVLVQAFLDAPVFPTRWRWNTTVALAVPRARAGRAVPPQLQRMLADDLMAAVFPDAAACLENIPGDRQIPDHPLVSQTVRDCLQEAMDFDGLAAVLSRIHANEIRCVARDVPEPSTLCAEILNARPYAFLDDAPLEERRAHAVYTRRAGEAPGADALGALDPHAIAQVCADQQPDPRDADELHDALLTCGFLTADEARAIAPALFDQLADGGRAARLRLGAADTATPDQPDDRASQVEVWIAAERWPEMRAVHPEAHAVPVISVPATRSARRWSRDAAVTEMLRGRLTLVGPTTAASLARSLAIAEAEAEAALVALEGEGVVLRGVFCAAEPPRSLGDRREARAPRARRDEAWVDHSQGDHRDRGDYSQGDHGDQGDHPQRDPSQRDHRDHHSQGDHRDQGDHSQKGHGDHGDTRGTAAQTGDSDYAVDAPGSRPRQRDDARMLGDCEHSVDEHVRSTPPGSPALPVSLLRSVDLVVSTSSARDLSVNGSERPRSHALPVNPPGSPDLPVNVPRALDLPVNVPGALDLPVNVPGAPDRPVNVPGAPDLPVNVPGAPDLPVNVPRAPDLPVNIPRAPDLPVNVPRAPDLRREPLQWCERSLLARIHRLTLTARRAEIEPVSPADFMRFLFVWQHVATASRVRGPEGLRAVIAQLDGFELSARAWERAVLPLRVEDYEPVLLDMLCLTGEVAWARLTGARTPLLSATTPIALFLREHATAWQALRAQRMQDDEGRVQDPDRAMSREGSEAHARTPDEAGRLTDIALRIAEVLRGRGASFARELTAVCPVSAEDLRTGLGRLVAEGAVSCDGFAGLRALAGPSTAAGGARADLAGRWTLVDRDVSGDREGAVQTQAWALLRRYGVVFRRLLAREPNAAPWRELARVYRRLEARGEIRGGRFVAGMSGEQFALSAAVSELRDVRRMRPDGLLVTLSAADPLNLAGIVTPGDRVPAMLGTRIVYRDGVPLSALEGDYLRPLTTVPAEIAAAVATALAGRPVPGVVSGYIGRGG